MAGKIVVSEIVSDATSSNLIKIGSGATLDLAGSAGSTVLPTSIPAANLTGSLPAGMGGKVLQVVQDTASNEVSSTANSFVDSGLEVAITPTTTSSKIYVQFIPGGMYTGSGGRSYLNIYRSVAGGSYSALVVPAGPNYGTGIQSDSMGNGHIFYLDTPSYTSGQAITYKLYFKSFNSVSVQIRNSNQEIGVGVAMEIAG
jgi:hypothetical protein